MELAIEMSDVRGGYGYIHKAGCGHLVDPMPIGSAATRAEASRLADDATGWGDFSDDPGAYDFSPCTARLTKGE